MSQFASSSVLRLTGSGLLLMASFALTLFLLPKLPLRAGALPRIQWMPRFTVPSRDSFFVYSVSDELSQMVLYHDLGESIGNARRADILFLGDSRMPLGLREEVIVPAAEQLGLKAFSLACGHVEKIDFALALIRKFDLRPKVVVAVGGPHIFTHRFSANAQRAMQLSHWEARKEWLEGDARWRAQTWLHSVVPKIDFFGERLTSSWIIYRSARTGWWEPAREPHGHYPVGFAAENASYEYLLPLARELEQELRNRGALLVLTVVPYGDTRVGHVPYLSEQLGVPGFVPDLPGLSTADGSHLNRGSALRLSRWFWKRFIGTNVVREKLGLPPRT